MTNISLISVATTRYKNLLLERKQEFKPLNVLIGPNGLGKSNVIRLLQFLKSCVVSPGDEVSSGPKNSQPMEKRERVRRRRYENVLPCRYNTKSHVTSF